MLIKLIEEYAKLVLVSLIVFIICGFAYWIITGKKVERRTVIQYKTVAPKLDDKAKSLLPNKHAHPPGDQTEETKAHQVPQPRATSIETAPIESDSDFIEESLETENAEDTDQQDPAHPHNVGEPSETQQLSTKELRRKELGQRAAILRKQFQDMLPIDGIADPESALQAINLRQEIIQIEKELGTAVFHGGDPIIALEIDKLVLSNLTKDGQIPVSIGPQMADLLEKGQEFELAERVRRATQRALKNGDKFFKPDHADGAR